MIVGAGGVGKGTIARELVARDDSLWLSRSWTTRPRREGEPEDAYTFVDREAFLRHVEDDGFLEFAEFLGNLYGTPWPEAQDGREVLLEIDAQGAAQIRARHPEALIVLILPPSREVQKARLVGRGDAPEAVRERLAIAEAEETQAHALADAVVVNDDLERAVREVAGIIEGYRAGGNHG